MRIRLTIFNDTISPRRIEAGSVRNLRLSFNEAHQLLTGF